MSKRKKVVTENIRTENILTEDRDYEFQKLLSLKNETSQLQNTIRKEVDVEDYTHVKWFTKQLKEIDAAEEEIIRVLAGTDVKLRHQGVWRSLPYLFEKYKKDIHCMFNDYLDSYISGLNASELIDLCDGHRKINELKRSLLGSIEYDQASNG
jgi:hypothetical protein